MYRMRSERPQSGTAVGRCPDLKTVKPPQDVGRGNAGHVPGGIARQCTTIARHLHDFNAWRHARLSFDHVTKFRQSEPKHIEPWPEIRCAGRSEHAYAIRHREPE